MLLHNAIELKRNLFRDVFEYREVATVGANSAPVSVWMDPAGMDEIKKTSNHSSFLRDVAVGIAPPNPHQHNQNDQFSLVAYIQDRRLLNSTFMDDVRRQARGEINVKFVGRIRQTAGTRNRPVSLGSSISHFRGTFGTLGCVTRLGDGALCLLSNNHILALVDRARIGDQIIQPGKTHFGRHPSDCVGTLLKTVPINIGGVLPNYVDCALAIRLPNIDFDHSTIRANRNLRGISGIPVATGLPVFKRGAASDDTDGTVHAFDIDNLLVSMSASGNQTIARFDNQIAISGTGDGAFSKPGDSGSLITDQDDRAVGLLFANSSTGGGNGRGLTFANPIEQVFNALDCTIYLG
ncbi:MAG: hypothetical protein ACOVN0_01105 [Niveispirillum sp.]|uniref:hypothetical protein n=1 Tax=Niveispirillum sp. TaxID=1917217 RepID=UPI003BA6B5D6